jgi:hypothetical protein
LGIYTGQLLDRTVEINPAVASGYSQNIAPPFQPAFFPCARHPARVLASINPVEASPAEAGFPIKSLLNGTPVDLLISKMEVCGKSDSEVVKRELQEV